MTAYKFPFICTAAKRCRCAETGKPIRKGDRVGYYPTEKIYYHEDSRHFQDIAAFHAFTPGEGVAV